MITLPEITDLFARLSSHLQTLNQEEEEEAIELSISKLNQSLNLDQNSRVRVLDTALSLMCFKAPQVFDTVIEYLVKTIVSVLSASISCKVLRFRNEEVLQIGSSITCGDCVQLIQVCCDILGKLEGHRMLSNLLSRAVVRVAVSASTYRFLLPSTPILDAKSIDGKNTAISKLISHLPGEFSLQNHEIPLRLLIWYLDPLTLKHDISKILQETMERPFLCLDKEFYERVEWQSVLICLVVSPIMFMETRALLHNWFLVTGLAFVLELLIKFVSLILDVNSRPTCWGLPAELGLELPFSNAYFPYKCQLLQTLAGPLSSENFLRLLHGTGSPVSLTRKQFHQTINPPAMNVATIDHKSFWALAINFPDWFYLASVLLFSEKSFQDNFQSKCSLGAFKLGQTHKVESPSHAAAAAARYIAWILNPVSKLHQDLLVDCLTTLSESWTLKQFHSGSPDKERASYGKKLKKPKYHDKEDCTLAKEYDCQTIGLWLRELQNIYVRYWSKDIDNSACCEATSSHSQIVLLRRIPLGILIGCSSHINEAGCELLLHYAATGRILQTREINGSRLKHVKLSYVQEDSIALMDECNKEEAVAGACIVFRLTDIVESMSASMFETEEDELDFVCRVKVRAGKYLIKCIKRLIQLKIEEDGVFMLTDLCSRLVQWRHKGREVLQVQEDLDDVISGLSHKLSSL